MSSPSRRSLGPALALLSGARLVVNIGQRFVYPFLPAIARGLGVSLQAAGFLVSARWAVGLATPAVVSIAGRGERRRRVAMLGLLLFASGAAMTAATGVYVGALFGFVLMGLGKPSYDVSAQAYVADRTPYERRARYLSVMELTWAGGLLIGAPLAGWLITRFGWASPFWLLAALALAAAALIPFVLERDQTGDHKATAPLRMDRQSIALLVAVALFVFGSELVFVTFGAWLEASFGLTLLGLSGAAVWIGASELAGEGTALLFTDRIGKRRAVIGGLLISIAGYAALVVAPEVLGIGLALLALALYGFEFTIVSAIPLATEVRPEARARYLAWFVVAMSLARTAGAATGLPLFDRFGLPAVAGLAAVVDVAAIVVISTQLSESPGHSEARGNSVQ